MEDEYDEVSVVNPGERDLEILFRRVNYAFIRRLSLNFRRGSLVFPYYLAANASALHCQIRALRIDGTLQGIDYALVDSLGVHLKPHTYATRIEGRLREDYVMLFTHNALRSTVRHLEFDLNMVRTFSTASKFNTVRTLPMPAKGRTTPVPPKSPPD